MGGKPQINHNFFFDRDGETLSREQIESIQRLSLEEMLEAIFKQNTFYRRKFRDGGWQSVPKFEQWHEFPFTTKSELVIDQAQPPPYGSNLTYPLEQYVRLHYELRGKTMPKYIKAPGAEDDIHR